MNINLFAECKNSKKQGDLGLGMAISYFVKNGYTVCLPLTDSQDYDLIVDNGKLNRVQIKTTSVKNKLGRFQVNLRTMGGNQKKYWCKKFNKENIELLYVITSEGTSYLVPTTAFEALSGIALYHTYDKYMISCQSGEVGGSQRTVNASGEIP